VLFCQFRQYTLARTESARSYREKTEMYSNLILHVLHVYWTKAYNWGVV